ncbi:hypothetical protein SAMN04488514_102202 [Kriegella aquimaris]|uniref:Uncharacterized protein n=1 Tax=Kriegella aquimaris TaxID=192904 RepID=A0A1G9LS50_9FLAO|nr:hypothetical protein SAMN04488514_102202 [Kriegella aquimaris]
MFNLNIVMTNLAIASFNQWCPKGIISVLDNSFLQMSQAVNHAIILEKELKFSIGV